MKTGVFKDFALFLLMSPIVSRIPEVISEVHAPALAQIEARLANLRVNGEVRRFLVCRMGSTGSSWLAKLLDSHAEVHCTHEDVLSLVYPAKECTNDDILRFIQIFAWNTKHEAYQVLGDVGSVWAGHVAHLRSVKTGILIRHPARILHTRLHVLRLGESYSAIPPDAEICLRELWGIRLRQYEAVDQIFLYELLTFASQLWVLDKTDMLIRIEDLQDVDCCQGVLKALTSLDYQRSLVEAAVLKRVNQRTGPETPVSEIVARFTSRQRGWYQSLLADVVPRFGYELLD